MIYSMDDGTVVKTENAIQSWDEDTYYDNGNCISVATGSQWTHETLHKSRKGRYWLEHTSDYQDFRGSAEWISNRSAARWLIANGELLPDDLEAFEDEVSE